FLLCFLLILLRLISTLFPYTTLFRSQDDIDLLPAWIGTEFDAEPWEALITTAAQRTAKDMVETAIGLHLPVALAGESDPLDPPRSEEHTSELQSRENLVCRLLLEKKK